MSRIEANSRDAGRPIMPGTLAPDTASEISAYPYDRLAPCRLDLPLQ
jgi:hypothetical protein